MNDNLLQMVSTEKAYEVRHWMREVHCSEAELYAAIVAVGNNLNDIRRYRKTFARKGTVDGRCANSGGSA